MQQESSNTKKIVISAVLLILVAFLVWFFFFRNTPQEQKYDEFGNPILSEVVGKDLIDLLEELQAVNLDASIFKSPGFVNLTDYSIELASQPQGRPNPFAPTSGAAVITAKKK